MKEIPGYPGYFATTDGRIFSSKPKLFGFMRQFKKHDGYLQTQLRGRFGSRSENVHRLVALTYIPNPLNKPTVNHKNGVRTDNRVSNLEWHTRKEQAVYSVNVLKTKHDWSRGERNSRTKFTSTDIVKIRAMFNSGAHPTNIAKQYGVTRQCITSIIKYQVWKHV